MQNTSISLTQKVSQLCAGILAPVALLVAINLYCFYRSLAGYFLADDFVHIAYLSNILPAHPGVLLQNFCGNWMQAQGTQFYRPLISLTLALDYWLGAGAPVVFHVTNICYQIASTIFLFFCCRRLLRGTGEFANVVAFAGAALFAAYPLHPEVVSWIIGRVDSVCTTFYLLAFWLYLKSYQDGKKYCLWLAIISFVASLLSKEMAVSLPAVLTLYLLVETKEMRWLPRVGLALKQTYPLWLTLCLYLVVRTLALGTILGGYGGSVGEGFNHSFVLRWFYDHSLARIVLPFNAEVFVAHDRLRNILNCLYVLAGLGLVARLVVFGKTSIPYRYLLFALGWFVLAMLPAAQVFNITDTLQCSRFVYLPTAPLCLFLSLIVMPVTIPPGTGSRYATQCARYACCIQYVRMALPYGYMALLCAFVFVFAAITYKNNLPWVHAGSEVRAFARALEQECAKLKPDTKLAILNVPYRNAGAHMIYNAAMLQVLLARPLSPRDFSKQVISFEPATYGDNELIAPARLRQLLAAGNKISFYRWDAKNNMVVPLHLISEPETVLLPDSCLARDISLLPSRLRTVHIVSPALDVPAAGVDFIRLTMNLKFKQPTVLPPALFVCWASNGDPFFTSRRRLAIPVVADGKPHTYMIPVSELKSWMSCERITQLDFELPCLAGQNVAGGDLIKFDRVELVDGSNLIPVLMPTGGGLKEGNDGIWQCLQAPLSFTYNAANIAGARKVVVEISQADSWFEHYSGTLRDAELSRHAGRQMTLGNLSGSFKLSAGDFPRPGYYEIRLFAISSGGAVVGYSSDPINIQLSGTNWRTGCNK